MPLMRIPYTDPLPAPRIIPPSASSTSGAIAALAEFLTAPPSPHLKSHSYSRKHRHTHLVPRSDSGRSAGAGHNPTSGGAGARAASIFGHGQHNNKTMVLTGAGISVASGLADYRGTNGIYTLNKSYRPIYYHEFIADHDARKRYWARSFLGWTNLARATPNVAHEAVGQLGRLGVVGGVITQNVDSFHTVAHPDLPTIELHGYLRTLTCLTCRNEYSRSSFQTQLTALNPAWSAFLAETLASGALTTEHPDERRQRGLRANPDGDVDVPDALYSTFRYPACPVCLEDPRKKVELDGDGAWLPTSKDGVLKPSVIMFGESISDRVKRAAEDAIDSASRILIVGSSLATYSAWRLVKRAKENGIPVGVLNLGGVRGEEDFFDHVAGENTGAQAFRCSEYADQILQEVARALENETNCFAPLRREGESGQGS